MVRVLYQWLPEEEAQPHTVPARPAFLYFLYMSPECATHLTTATIAGLKSDCSCTVVVVRLRLHGCGCGWRLRQLWFPLNEFCESYLCHTSHLVVIVLLVPLHHILLPFLSHPPLRKQEPQHVTKEV